MSDSDRNNNNNENRNSMSASSAPDLHINIKAVPFHLNKEMLAKRSSQVSLLLERNEMDELRLILRDLEVDPETFELVARFCYGLEVKFTSDNIVSVLCIAYYLGMNEEQSSNNLLGKASEFLEQRVFPCWNETVNALRSGDKSLDKLADVGLVDLFFDSLIEKASYDPRLLGEMIKNREEESDDYRPNPRRRLFVKDWKSEDLITVPLRLYEPLMIRTIKSRSIPVEYIVLSVCKYAKKWVFDAEESQLGQRREVVEAVERLLPHPRGLISCEFLFESLKHSIWLEASSECRKGFEIRITKQLDMARPTDLKILSRGYREKAESFEDITLVKTVVTSFYSYYANEDSEDVLHFKKVAKLLEEFLFLAASETSLKLEAFVELAEITVASSQGILRYADGIYKAIDAFLESHRYLTESEKMEVCKFLECKKLSQEGCDQAAKNQRLPIRIVIQVLVASQLQIRDTVAKEIKVIEEKVDEEDEEGEIGVSSDEDEMENMSNKLLGLEIENHECVVHRWKKTKKKKSNKLSVWRQVKRKFGCLTSSSSSVDACTCDVNKKKKKIHHHYK
ncbi:PREDICTED: BTB/POZ domain-containing protein At5g17580-like [Camelina sativa]|uniref:BTB/POZ domain-containing protein At5g17580-like n=1 Tax=Camelina sativa TaxID=90675 RepID=A0ABM0VC27_CAMSA|nr:PREDICTED: BTB/POZ domain-containing protein At5g17580-like [Camelina sativa]